MARKPGGAYIDDLPDRADGQGYYDLVSTRDEYLAFHYPGEDPLAALLGERAPPLDERYPFCLRRLWEPRPEGRALDVGAATGRVAFDLARDHREAWGLDRSANLVRGAHEVRTLGRARYRTTVEGRLTRSWDVPVQVTGKVRFLVGDALALPLPEGAFDTVVALNLVDRVPDPRRALDELARATAPGGLLILGSPFTWLESFTPPESWLGGFERDGRPVRGNRAIREHLAPAFTLLDETRQPFFIPHHARSGQLGVAHILRLRREP